MTHFIWKYCIELLSRELPPDEFNTWIICLLVRQRNGQYVLIAPNAYVRDHVVANYLERIRDVFENLGEKRESVVVDLHITDSKNESGLGSTGNSSLSD